MAPERCLSTYYLEQTFTIAACGALAAVFLLEWYSGKLGYFIKDKYFLLVLTGALLLLALVVVRAVAVWFSVEGPRLTLAGDLAYWLKAKAPQPTWRGASIPAAQRALAVPVIPNYGDACARGPERRWAPWRYLVLLLPVALYFLVPAESLGGGHDNEEELHATLPQLEEAALWDHLRKSYEGKTVRLLGRYVGQNADHFTLVRFTVWPGRHPPSFKVLVIVDFSRAEEKALAPTLEGKWVEVTGQVQFLVGEDGSFAPAIVIKPTPEKKLARLVKVVPAPDNPFID